MSTATGKPRPYRSHLIPACQPCRTRKSRCKTDVPGKPCAMCEVHGTECTRGSASTGSTRAATRRKATEARNATRNSINPSSLPVPNQPDTAQPLTTSSPQLNWPASAHPNPGQPNTTPGVSIGGEGGTLDETGDDNVHVVGPVLASDNEVLEPYLSAVPETGRYRRNIRTGTFRMARPVLFTTISRRPLGVTNNQTLAAAKCEVIEKILEPHCHVIIEMYMTTANASMPMFDGAQFMDLYVNQKDKISPALLSNLYGNAFVYWKQHASRTQSPCPDGRFIWVQAHEALHSETFLSPGISTVMALLLNVDGRPSTSPFNNAGMIGTAVALAHALGLNRDPSQWDIHEAEKDMRSRIWWQVVLADRWCSLSYGTPPHVRSSQFDVALPTVDSLCQATQARDSLSSQVYISLVSLTAVLGHVLDYVYDLTTPSSSSMPPEGNCDFLEIQLGAWKDQLHVDMRAIAIRGTRLNIPGAANLRLAFLALELLLSRVELDLDDRRAGYNVSRKHSSIRAKRAAEDVMLFVESLNESNIYGFWLPQNGSTLTSAAAFLLRSAVASISNGDIVGGNTHLDQATRMLRKLRELQQLYGWDLADHCISQYGELIDRMQTMRHANDGGHPNQEPIMVSLPDIEEFMADSTDFPSMELDALFPSLWDMFET